MKAYKKYTVPAREDRILSHVCCDFCGKKSTCNLDWDGERFIESVQTELRLTRFYHDGEGMEKISIDICPDCFKNKLVPWIESQGIKVEEEKEDW